MSWKNTHDRYGRLSMAMHWVMLILLIAVYAAILLRQEFPRGSETRELFKTWHAMLGLSVFALVFIRLTIRFSSPTPRIVPAPSVWQQHAAMLVHIALYGFLIAMPLLGWLLLSAEGKQIPFFGLSLPAIWSADKDVAHWVEDIHTTTGEVGYYLIGLHAAASLFHHYVLRDNTLLRMLPGRSSTATRRSDD